MIGYKKVGGLRFLKVGRLNISWSLTKKRPCDSQRGTALDPIDTCLRLIVALLWVMILTQFPEESLAAVMWLAGSGG